MWTDSFQVTDPALRTDGFRVLSKVQHEIQRGGRHLTDVILPKSPDSPRGTRLCMGSGIENLYRA